MRTTISSTEAVRNFSELLNNIRYRGDHYTVIRGGKPAASLAPVEPSTSGCTLAELREIFQALPHLDQSDTTFEDDIMSAAAFQPPMPKAIAWE